MIVLAGLPPQHYAWARAELEAARSPRVVVGAPSGVGDSALYPEQLIDTLLRAVAGFALRRRTKGPARPPAPGSITLLYVPARDEERLLRAFDFAVLPAPLATLGTFSERGRMLRHEKEAVAAALEDALAEGGRARSALNQVKQRTKRRAEADALLLPPVNFHLRDDRLAATFRAFRSGQRPPDDRFAELQPHSLRRGDLPRLGPDEVRSVHVDARGLAFLHAHDAAFHAVARELEEQAERPSQQRLLRRLYRFGGPLPDGFHHDVQRRDGQEMDKVTFDCAVNGPILVSGPHANVYPDDFVRAPGKQKI